MSESPARSKMCVETGWHRGVVQGGHSWRYVLTRLAAGFPMVTDGVVLIYLDDDGNKRTAICDYICGYPHLWHGDRGALRL